MLLPKSARDLADWAVEQKKRCFASQRQRLDSYSRWRAYLTTGSADPSQPAILNKMGPHADRLHSYLFSPAECRFMVEFGPRASPEWQRRELEISRLITKEFHSSNVDMAFGDATFWSIPYGAAFVKLGIKTSLETTPEADTSWVRSLWKRGRRRPSRGVLPDSQRQVFDCFDPYVILPQAMGVSDEQVNGLDRQEVIVQQIPITKYELARRLRYHPDASNIIQRALASVTTRDPDDLTFMHQVIIGGQNPLVANGTTTGTSQVSIFDQSPYPQLDARQLAQILWLTEIWVIDDERGDYTTIQYIEPDIVIEGDLIRRNLFIPGHHPYTLVQPNEQQGYFWGRSEFADLHLLQDTIAQRLLDIVKIGKLQAQPPMHGSGISGNVAEIRRSMRTPNGIYLSDMPNAKLEKMAPDLPSDSYQNLDTLIRYFDEIAGFQPTLMGQGEQGVRAGVHAASLQRAAGARIRDRALIVERQCAELGSLCLDVMATKDPTLYHPDQGGGYLLADLPEDRGIMVDSHSSSPAFTEDSKALAFALARSGAVTPKGLLLLTQPPLLDQLLMMLDDKEKAEAEMIKAHPEILSRGKKKK